MGEKLASGQLCTCQKAVTTGERENAPLDNTTEPPPTETTKNITRPRVIPATEPDGNTGRRKRSQRGIGRTEAGDGKVMARPEWRRTETHESQSA